MQDLAFGPFAPARHFVPPLAPSPLLSDATQQAHIVLLCCLPRRNMQGLCMAVVKS